MSSRFNEDRIVRSPALRYALLALTLGTAMVVSMPGCASDRAYNPDGLANDQFSRVAYICENVVGLDPNEPLTGGNYLGAPRLDYYTNHYRGCVLSLSDSLEGGMAADAARAAGESCHARGYAAGSPELALCELNSSTSTAATAQSTPASVQTISENISRPEVSYRSASNAEHHRRQNLACAALGIEPAKDDFGRCVHNLDAMFYAIDNPIL